MIREDGRALYFPRRRSRRFEAGTCGQRGLHMNTKGIARRLEANDQGRLMTGTDFA